MKFMNYIQTKKDGGQTIMLLQYAKVKEEGMYVF